MPAAAGSRRTLKTVLVRVVVAVVTWLALCSLFLGPGPSVDPAGAAQTATTVPPTEGSVPPPETTTSAVVTTTSAEPPTTEAVPFEEESTSEADDEVPADEVDSTTTIVEEEVEEPTTTTTVRTTTTVAPATTRPPAPGATTTSAAVPSSAASSNGGATTGSGAESSGDDSQDVLRIVMATLVVVGLLIGLLTWRYWRYSDPKRGLAPARARIPVSRSPTLVNGVDATAAQGAYGEPTELVTSATLAPSAWSAGTHDDVALRPAPGPLDHDETAVFTDDPTDPGGWPLPDRQPVGSE